MKIKNFQAQDLNMYDNSQSNKFLETKQSIRNILQNLIDIIFKKVE